MNLVGTSFANLPTPCLVVDRAAMERNLSAMQCFLNAKGKALRAHAKMHKSSRIAAMQRAQGAIGICVAKLSEAQVLIAKNVDGILLTGPVVTDEAHARLLRCHAQAPDLMVTIDDLENAKRLSAMLARERRTMRCLLDIDAGFHRTGVPPEAAMEFAASLRKLPGLDICGVQAYAGDLQHVVSYTRRRERSLCALGDVANFVRELRRKGLAVDIFSVGGTGTARIDAEIPEVTEIQAGSYVFMDEEYFAIEWGPSDETKAAGFEPALSVLSTVVSANHPGMATIDAGLKAMYLHGGLPKVRTACEPAPAFDWFGDEYGKITSADPQKKFSVGQKVTLSISHCDPTINLFDVFYVLDDDMVVEVIPIDLRGCSQ